MEITTDAKKALAKLLHGVTPHTESDLLSKIQDKETLDEIATVLNPAFDNFVASIKEDNKSKGKRERMDDFEKNLRAKYGVDSSTQGEALVDKIVESVKSKALEDYKKDHPTDNNPENWTEAQIKSYVEGTDHYKTVTANLQADLEKAETEFTSYKSKNEEANIHRAVKKFATKLLLAKNPKLEESESVKETRINDFVNAVINAGNWRVNSDDTIDLLDEDGNVMKDDRSRPIKPETKILSIADNRFVYHAADPTKDPPPTIDPNDPKKPTQEIDKTVDDLKKMSLDEAAKWATTQDTKEKRKAAGEMFAEAFPE